MFTSKSQLQKKTPECGVDRENFLSLLVDQYLNSSSFDAKCQVLANLANFAYDPVNYGYIRDVGVLDIFLHVLKHESNEKLLHFAISGVCNLCIDPVNKNYILENTQLKHFECLLKSTNIESVANCITTLIYLCNEQTKTELTKSDIIEQIKELQKSEDKRLSNLATIYLQDVCNLLV